MAIKDSIIHCRVDLEPDGFHAGHAFAVNLAFEVTGHPLGEKRDERKARSHYKLFLNGLEMVELHLFEAPFTEGQPIKHLGPVNTLPLSSEKDYRAVFSWLDKHAASNTYWVSEANWQPENAVDANNLKATYRLRAAQAWNAPVGHRTRLTHVVEQDIKSNYFVILPFCISGAESVDFDQIVYEKHLGGGREPNYKVDALDFSYVSGFGIGRTICRTNVIGEGITDAGLRLSELDPGMRNDGYLRVNHDAADVRRIVRTIEERAASVLNAHGSLQPSDRRERGMFDAYFGVQINGEAPGNGDPDTRQYYWGAASWLVVARLLTALDMTVIAIMRPDSKLGAAVEGDVLAPFVSGLLDKVLSVPTDGKAIAKALRAVLSEKCALTSEGHKALRWPALIEALRHVYDIPAIRKDAANRTLPPANMLEFISHMIESYAQIDTGAADEIPTIAREFALTLGRNSVQEISVALDGLEESLSGESGFERAIIRVLESVENGANTPPKLAFLLAAELAGNANPDPAFVGAIDQAWSDYKSLLDSPFNGGEAVRRSAGACFAKLLLRGLQVSPDQMESADLRRLVRDADFYRSRFYGAASTVRCFDDALSALVTPDRRYLPVEFVGELPARLSDLYSRAVETIAVGPGRFIPDSTPQPLTVQIASNHDAANVDAFGKALNGICVAIRRRDKHLGDWAHVNLADLAWGAPARNGNEVKAEGALHPMLPVTSDGRGSMFIDYEGFPFADGATDERIAGDSATSYSEQPKPFYNAQPHDPRHSGFERLPRLAYGRKFQSFSFVTTNSGSLPRKLQLSAAEPWLPYSKIEAPIHGGSGAPLTNDVVGCIDYQRRTAIAQMGLREDAGHIGKALVEVQPLADDYPRVGIVAARGTAGTVDLMRDSDGMGRMFVPNRTGSQTVWQFTDVRWSGSPATLRINLYEGNPSTPEDDGAIKIEISDASKFSNASSLSLVFDTAVDAKRALARTVQIHADGTLIGKAQLTAGEKHYWIRVTLTGKTADFTTMTFGGFDELKPDGVVAPLLILKPTGTNVWKTSIPTETKAKVSTPRVGYIDFSRWIANEDLRNRAYKLSGPGDANFDRARRFDFALLAAYNMRHLDEELARLLDNLPDPAVEHVEATIFVADSLASDTGDAARQRIDLRDGFAQVIASMDAIEDEARAIYNHKRDVGDQVTAPNPVPWTPWGLRSALLNRLDQRFALDLEVRSGALALEMSPARPDPAGAVKRYQFAKFKAAAPSSAVSHLSLSALVPEHHFQKQSRHPPAFDLGLLEYAKRMTADQYYVFPSASLRIEVMHDGMGVLTANDNAIGIRLAEDMISVQPIVNVRRYDLTTASEARKGDYEHWRLLGAIRTTTQRWRPTGKPIYNQVNPREHVYVGEGQKRPTKFPHPALRLGLGGGRSALAQFEREAFFDRSDIDAQTIPQLLSPLPARTVIQQFPWEQLSATYFRHRFTLNSRYIGALNERARGVCRAWRQEKENRPTAAHLWTMRVAMLADLSRLEVTRPQLRALVPLTMAPGGEDALSSVPPVAAILQEPPFSRGGLADRIISEIKTGFGYGFEAPNPDPTPVEILDSRKEIGPNPQLTYRALPANQALGLAISSEGPAGLTFDLPGAPAPAFPNTLISLRPVSLSGDRPSLSETLVGVSMRRYIDPFWTTADEIAKERSAISLDPERSWWIGQRELTDNVELSYRLAGAVAAFPLATIRVSPSTVKVYGIKEAIDGVAGAVEPDVEIGRAATSNISSIAFLSCRIAPARYCVSVLATRKGINIARGESTAPVVLASFEWSPLKVGDDNAPQPELLELLAQSATPGNLIAIETMASAATTLRWTHCSQDFNIVHTLADGDSRPVATPHLARNLVAKIDRTDGALQFGFVNGTDAAQLCPSTAGNIYPVNVHRHLAVITSRFLKELGTPVETFCRASLVTGIRSELMIRAEDSLSGIETIEEAARIVEFETPAAIVCDAATPAPPAFKSAYFDLLSTGYQTNNAIRLSLRFVGSRVHLQKFSKLTIELRQPGRAPMPLTFALHDAGRLTTGATVVIRPSSAQPLQAWVTFSDGGHQPVQSTPAAISLAFDGSVQGFFLALQSDASDASEFWTDISMLHGSAAEAFSTTAEETPAAGFDFNWLFSGTHGENDPQAAVSAAGLSRMTEAQARIVTVSPPIPIMSIA